MPVAPARVLVVGIEPHQAATSLLHGIHIGIGPLHSPLVHRLLFPNTPFHHPSPPLTFRLLPLALLLMARLGGMVYAFVGSLTEYCCAAWHIHCLPGRREGGVTVLDTPGWAAFTFGLLRPRVFISEAVWNSPHRAAVLAHEWGHARRRDPLRRFLVRATQRLLWYLPFWQRLSEQSDFEAERACDLRACKVVGRPAYARALLAFVDQVGGHIAPKSLAAAFPSESSNGLDRQGLVRRAQCLTDMTEDTTPRLFWPLFALFYCLIMLLA